MSPPLLPGLGASTFVASDAIPPGVCAVSKNDIVVWFGPLRNMPLEQMPAQCKINISKRDFDRINAKMREDHPNAPEVIALDQAKR